MIVIPNLLIFKHHKWLFISILKRIMKVRKPKIIAFKASLLCDAKRHSFMKNKEFAGVHNLLIFK
jgi:hypothetical protein